MIKQINFIHHISDIHIRNYKRHDEYNRVFNTLYNSLKERVKEDHVICLTGDIVHSKTDVSPELFNEVQKFLYKLCEISTVILIPGNHDANLNNAHRMDALTPIVNALDNKNLLYVKDSEVLEFGGIKFYHWSVFDNTTKYQKPSPEETFTKICLFHGAVNSSTTEVGYTLENENIKVESFRGFDMVLLGDIHKFQYLNEQKTIAYPGSLIQQNHGESQIHGYLLWDVRKKSSEFIEIENDTAFYTIDVDLGKYNPIPKDIANNLYLRVRYKNTDRSTIKDIVDSIRRDKNIVEISMQRINDFQSKEKSISSVRGVDFRSQSQQRTLLLNYLSQKHKMSEEAIAKVYEINDQVNKVISKSDVPRNTMWIPKKFEFENMFSYGKGNYIDFKSMKGTYGLFAPNATGKSTLLDSLTYCIFDKCTKTTRGHQVMNSNSDTFYCKLNFELNGLDYFIIRDAKRQKSGNVRVEVDFYYLDEYGSKVSLNGKDRTDTNNNIKALLGNYEDFVLTTLSTQSNNTGFIDMNQKDRKDLLSQFMDIGVFEEMYNIANELAKETSAVLKHYQKNDYESDLHNFIEELKLNKSLLQTASKQLENHENEKIDCTNRIVELATKLQSVDSSIIDEESIKKDIKKYEDYLREIEDQKNTIKSKHKTTEDSIIELEKSIQHIDELELEEALKHCISVKEKLHKVEIEYKMLENHMSHKSDKMEKLKELEYDPNCKYCMNNVFVKDAIETKNDIERDKEKLKEIKLKKSSLEIELAGCEDSELDKIAYTSTQKKIADLKNQISTLNSNLEQLTTKELKFQILVNENNEKLRLRENQILTIKNNEQINAQIEEIKKEQKKIEALISELKPVAKDRELSVKMLEKTISDTKNQIDKRKGLEEKYKNYEYYLQATHRDGIPHDLISVTIPQIEEEVNNILSQLVDFKVIFETDDKNINAYIAYTEDKFWPLELTSGMEKFVSSLAIRSALINISTLPRPNFVAIDEGFGSLDKSNLSSMSMLFDYLKTQFRFLIIISHIDSMRDVVDSYIEINKHNGRSSVKYQ